MRDYSGTNQNTQNANGVSNIDVAAFSMACIVSVDAGTTELLFQTAAAISSGNQRASLEAAGPTGAGDWAPLFTEHLELRYCYFVSVTRRASENVSPATRTT